MTIRVVRPGSPRDPNEDVRFGTVRIGTVRIARRATDARQWRGFVRRYRAEMCRPAAGRRLGLSAALSPREQHPVGCSCEDEAHCHCSAVRERLAVRRARLA